MRVRSLLTILIGFLVAGGAVVYTNVFLKSPVAQRPTVDVVVAAEKISFGQIIEGNKLQVQAWPADAVPPGTFSSIKQVVGTNIKQVVGTNDVQQRRAKFIVAKGDVLFASKVSDFGESVSITQQIDPAMRAVTIRVNDVTGVAGFIAPSDRIDLTLTRTVDQNLITSTILQDVEVLGIDQKTAGARSEPAKIKTVTVQVKPADAQKLALAQQAGTLSLSLRHIDAADQQVLDSISVSDLTEQATPKPKKVKRGLPSIVVNRAGQRSTIEVPSG